MNRLKVTKDRTKQVLASIRALTREQVLVGVPDETAERQPDPKDPHPLNNAAIGYIMETGSPAQNIPARPFLVPGVEAASDQIEKHLGLAAKAALSGDRGAVEAGLVRAGAAAQVAVQAKITDGPFVPLSPSTVAKRRAKGRTDATPLVDEGQLRRAIRYVIRPQG